MHKIENWQAAIGHGSMNDDFLPVSIRFVCVVSVSYNNYNLEI